MIRVIIPSLLALGTGLLMPLLGSAQVQGTVRDPRAESGWELLDAAVDDAAALHIPSNRIYIFAAAATLLQPSRPAQAIQMLDKAFDEVGRALSTGGENAIERQRRDALEDSRRKLILEVALVNPKHALELFGKSQTEEAESGRYHPDQDFKRRLLGEVAPKYPESVLNLGLDELAAELFPDALDTYSTLRQYNADFGKVLLSAIVSRISTDAPDPKSPQVRTAFLLLSELHQTSLEGEPQQEPPALMASLTNLVGDALLTEKKSDYVFLSEPLESYIAAIAPYAAEKAEKLRNRAQEQANSHPFSPDQFAAQLQNADYDGALETAEDAPAETKAFAFEQIALSSMRSGDVARAERIMSARVIDGATRQRFANSLAATRAQDQDETSRIPEAMRGRQSQASRQSMAALLAFIHAGASGSDSGDKVQAEIQQLNELLDKEPNSEKEFGPALVSGDEFTFVAFSPVIEAVEAIAEQIAQGETLHPRTATALINRFKKREFRAIAKLRIAESFLADKQG